jgi:hypothetical protein
MFWKIPSSVFTEIQDLLSLKEQFIMILNGSPIVPTVDYYRESLISYTNMKLGLFRTEIPYFNLPRQLVCVETRNQQYSRSQPYPVNFFYVKEGKGTITFIGRGGHSFNAGTTIVFPSSFLFPFFIEGDLKLYIPV